MDNPSPARVLEQNWQVLLGDYNEEEQRTRVAWTRRAAVIFMVFVLAGAAMDLIAYPAKAAEFLRWRAVCAGVLAILLGVSFLPVGPFGIRGIGHAIAASPAVLVLYMVLLTAGGVSPYYAGLNIIMLGSCLLLRWRVVDGFVHASFCLSGYWTIAFATNTPVETTATSLAFLTTTAVVCCLGLYFYERLRFRVYRVRWLAGKTAAEQAAPETGPQPAPGPEGS
ncbi:MAG: hypothetical protein HKN82_12550 [Akkermansiaceae bacterium]|nr:hypothetical protein [Akkermansiaceae bacterium]NNM29875.1 hypothetical protein [Akkermansiaceae bacterium]